jgi:RNA polymerase sigma-70 factor (ECF subfamily)
MSQRDERFRVLFEEHFARVYRRLRRLGVPPADVEDATQSVFVVLDRKLWRVRPGSEASFLHRTARRVASGYRRARRRQRLDPEGLKNVEAPDPSGNPEELLAERRNREQLDRFLDALPFKLREVFVLHELENLTRDEIAAEVGIPPGTVASRLQKAREKFNAYVAAYVNQHVDEFLRPAKPAESKEPENGAVSDSPAPTQADDSDAPVTNSEATRSLDTSRDDVGVSPLEET